MSNSIVTLLLLAVLFTRCGPSAADSNKLNTGTGDNGFTQTCTLTVDGNKQDFTGEDILTMTYVDQKIAGLSVMSEKKNIQFTVSAYMPVLQTGTYKVYDCKGPSICAPEMDGKSQSAIYGPYPKDPMPPLNSFRIAYNAPALGLAPLSFVITAVTDEQQPGVPWKTKRVKGSLSGTLAYAEKQGQDWHVTGQPTKIEGVFDLYCTLR